MYIKCTDGVSPKAVDLDDVWWVGIQSSTSQWINVIHAGSSTLRLSPTSRCDQPHQQFARCNRKHVPILQYNACLISMFMLSSRSTSCAALPQAREPLAASNSTHWVHLHKTTLKSRGPVTISGPRGVRCRAARRTDQWVYDAYAENFFCCFFFFSIILEDLISG